jgi:glycosyltransferase involved in cell wall biosynthesis
LAGKPLYLCEDVLALPAQLGVEDKVVWTGQVPQSDLAALYTGADLLAFLPAYEGFGLPPLEAMACGTPVLSASTTSLPEAVGDAALLVDPNEHGLVVRTMHRLLADDQLRDRLRGLGAERVRLFQPAPRARDVVAVYQECVAVAGSSMRDRRVRVTEPVASAAHDGGPHGAT